MTFTRAGEGSKMAARCRKIMVNPARGMRATIRQIATCIIVAVALLSTACAASPADVEATLSPDAIDAFNRQQENIANSPAPTQSNDIETNEAGEQLLQRFVTGEFESDDCDFILAELPVEPECGWLIRPLHGSFTDDVRLPVAVFKATGDNPQPDPLIYLHGGPGGGIVAFLGAELLAGGTVYDRLIAPFAQDRDVIMFDQRGAGLAEPDLSCDAEAEWFRAQDSDPHTYVPRTAKLCATDFRLNGVRLDQFSRQSSADDVMVLARELGYDSFNIHGSSWGGILGYTVAQLHPEWVRASVLDSPLSVDTDITASMPASFRESLEAVQANCDRSSSCSSRHGNIVDRYIRVFDQLDETPRPIVLFDLFQVMLTADELSWLLFALLYAPDAIQQVPELLLQLENANTQLVQELVSQYGWGWGMDFAFLTYMCTDFVATASPDQIAAQQLGIDAFDRVDDAPDGRGHTAQDLCQTMEVQAPAVPALREITPTTPIIVFAGSMDPITPYSSGQRIVDGIPNGVFVGFQDLSHGVTSDPCGTQIAVEFLRDPSAEPDITCSLPENRPAFSFDS